MHKKWFVMILWFVIGFYVQPAFSADEPLSAWNDAMGVRTLASAWLLLDKEADNTRIRIYRMDEGKLPCQNDPKRTCHFERLAIGLATTGEPPGHKVYLTPLAIFWQYPEIVRHVDAARPDDFIQITVKETAESRAGKGMTSREARKDRHKQRTLFVNLHEAYLQ